MIGLAPVAWSLAVSHDAVPLIAPVGSAAVSAATSARICAAEPALVNRYSICAAAGAPGGRRTAAWAGATQAAAGPVVEGAYPNKVNGGFTGAGGMVAFATGGGGAAWS